MHMKLKLHLAPIVALGCAVTAGSAWAATGTLAANPNPCLIAPGAHDCTSNLSWSTQGASQARVFVQAEGKAASAEKEFGSGKACAKCGASWIEANTKYVFTLVDFSSGSRGAVLATVTVTAEGGPRPGNRGAKGTISASPNPCLIMPNKNDCTVYLSWTTTGAEHARVYVKAEGAKASPEKEFGTGKACAKCGASWIEAGTKYLFTLYDFSTGSQGAALDSIVVTGNR